MGQDGQHKLIYAAGVAAALLLALIVYAVVRTSQASVDRPQTVDEPMRTVPTSTTGVGSPGSRSTTSVTSTTSTTSSTDTASPTDTTSTTDSTSSGASSTTLDSPTATASILVPPTSTTSLTPPFSISPDALSPTLETPNP